MFDLRRGCSSDVSDVQSLNIKVFYWRTGVWMILLFIRLWKFKLSITCRGPHILWAHFVKWWYFNDSNAFLIERRKLRMILTLLHFYRLRKSHFQGYWWEFNVFFALVQFSYLQTNGEYLKRIFFRIPWRGPSLRSEKCPIFIFNIYQINFAFKSDERKMS